MLNLLRFAARTTAVSCMFLFAATTSEPASGQVVVPPNSNGYYPGNYWNGYGVYRPYYYQRWQYVGPGYFNGAYGNPVMNGILPYPSGRIYNAAGGPSLNSGLFPQTVPPGTNSLLPYGWW